MTNITAIQRAKPLIDFLDDNVMSNFTELIKKYYNVRIFYLISFPRSGNGWIRYMITEALLQNKGVNLQNSQRSIYTHNNIKAHSIVTQTGHSYGIEEFFPDFYAIDQTKLDYNYFENFLNKNNRNVYIKTHHLIFRKDVKIVYLYRNPKDTFISYFNLENLSDPLFRDELYKDDFVNFFKQSIKIYNNVYERMFKFYLNKINLNYQNVLLIRMEDIIKDGFEYFRKLLHFFEINSSYSDMRNILTRNPKIVSTKIGLEEFWDKELDNLISNSINCYVGNYFD